MTGEEWARRLGTDDAPALRPLQAQVLDTLTASPAPYGALCGLDVGVGKTLLSLLIPQALGCRDGEALLLLPAANKQQTLDAFDAWGKFFPGVRPKVLAYEKLSSKSGVDALRKMAPQVIIADEAHKIGNPDAARTKRFLSYMFDNMHVRFVPMSGSFSKGGVEEFAHLAALALRDRSPVPINADLDVLHAWMSPDILHDDTLVPHIVRSLVPDVRSPTPAQVRDAFRRRLVTTPGVVWSTSGSSTVPLSLRSWRTEVTDRTRAFVEDLDKHWRLPDGTEIVSAAEYARHSQTLAYGFFAVPDWDAVGGFDEEWNEARLAWGRAARGYVTYGSLADSIGRAQDLAASGGGPVALRRAWADWAAVRDRIQNVPSAAVWCDDDQINIAGEALQRLYPGTLVWYRSRALADLIEAAGLPVYRRGQAGPEDHRTSAGVSIGVHGTGWHAAHFRRSLVLQPPSNAGIWHQLIGRTHRAGQRREVEILVAQTVPAMKIALQKARVRAEAIATESGQEQKLLVATWRI